MSIGNKFTTNLQTLISQKESNNITTSRCCSPLISMASKLTTEHAKSGNVTSNWTHPHIEKILGCLDPKKRQIWIVLIQKGKRKLTLIWSVPPRAVSTSSSVDVWVCKNNPSSQINTHPFCSQNSSMTHNSDSSLFNYATNIVQNH